MVTKGDQYDVREARATVRNLGKPVDLARRYYEEGADEITFLNITAFRDFPLADQPMLEVLRRTSERVFVPLTIGGGIRAFTDAAGPALLGPGRGRTSTSAPAPTRSPSARTRWRRSRQYLARGRQGRHQRHRADRRGSTATRRW